LFSSLISLHCRQFFHRRENAMSNKDPKLNKTNEQDGLVPAETDVNSVEPVLNASGADPSDTNTTEENVQPDGFEDNPVDEVDLSADDLLDDVRRSLITDAADVEEAEKSKWWKRIGRGSRKKTDSDEDASESNAIPVDEPVDLESQQDSVVSEYAEQLDDLIDMLEEDGTKEPALEMPEDEVRHEDLVIPDDEPQEVIDLVELKKRAFSSRGAAEGESFSEVRAVALDDGEEVFVEVEVKAEDPTQERINSIKNALRPYQRYFYFVVIFVALIMVVVVSASLYQIYLRSLPTPPVEEVAALPYPVAMNLPGDIRFTLGKGILDNNGKWEPNGAEWLEGTEVCRWIAIPYSRQLEAVVRTLTQSDQIDLTMSNNDKLTYTVYSIEQLKIEEMQKLDTNAPCMLLMLAQPGADERWVVTAKP